MIRDIPMTYCQRVAVELFLDGFPMAQIRGLYKKIPDPIYDFNKPETHIQNYLREIVKCSVN